MQFHWLKNVFLLSRDYFGRFSPSFCICSSPETFIRAKKKIITIFFEATEEQRLRLMVQQQATFDGGRNRSHSKLRREI